MHELDGSLGPNASATVLRLTAFVARKQQDRSACRTEKCGRRARMTWFCGPIHPTFEQSGDHRGFLHSKALDLQERPGDPDSERQSTWGMSCESGQV
jgi:hypothetical protein